MEGMIKVDTMHSVKGLEADHVAVYLEMPTKVQEAWFSNQDSERRVLYVALTRARKSIHLIFSQNNNNYPVNARNFTTSSENVVKSDLNTEIGYNEENN